MPSWDEKFLNDVLRHFRAGECAEILMKEWLKGWDYENLKNDEWWNKFNFSYFFLKFC